MPTLENISYTEIINKDDVSQRKFFEDLPLIPEYQNVLKNESLKEFESILEKLSQQTTTYQKIQKQPLLEEDEQILSHTTRENIALLVDNLSKGEENIENILKSSEFEKEDIPKIVSYLSEIYQKLLYQKKIVNRYHESLILTLIPQPIKLIEEMNMDIMNLNYNLLLDSLDPKIEKIEKIYKKIYKKDELDKLKILSKELLDNMEKNSLLDYLKGISEILTEKKTKSKPEIKLEISKLDISNYALNEILINDYIVDDLEIPEKEIIKLANKYENVLPNILTKMYLLKHIFIQKEDQRNPMDSKMSVDYLKNLEM